MKRLITPLILSLSLLLGTGIAAAAFKSNALAGLRVVLVSGAGAGVVFLNSVLGVGLAGKGDARKSKPVAAIKN